MIPILSLVPLHHHNIWEDHGRRVWKGEGQQINPPIDGMKDLSRAAHHLVPLLEHISSAGRLSLHYIKAVVSNRYIMPSLTTLSRWFLPSDFGAQLSAPTV